MSAGFSTPKIVCISFILARAKLNTFVKYPVPSLVPTLCLKSLANASPGAPKLLSSPSLSWKIVLKVRVAASTFEFGISPVSIILLTVLFRVFCAPFVITFSTCSTFSSILAFCSYLKLLFLVAAITSCIYSVKTGFWVNLLFATFEYLVKKAFILEAIFLKKDSV